MDIEKSVLFSSNNEEDIDIKIKEYLKSTLEPEIFDHWIENFVFEKKGNTLIASYYGNDKINEFKKNYKEAIWLRICSAVGYVKKFKIVAAKGQMPEKYQMPAADNVKAKVPEPGFDVPAFDEMPAYKAEPVVFAKEEQFAKENYIETHFSESKRNKREPQREKRPASKSLKVAKLFCISLVFAAVMLAVAVTGFSYIANRNFTETFYSSGNLKANGKIRIIQISDLHTARYGADNKKLIDRVTKLKPDIIVYTGDCVDAAFDDNQRIVSLISALKDVAPSYYVYGNNEVKKVYGDGFTKDEIDEMLGFNDTNRNPEALYTYDDALEAELEAAGVKVLKDEYDSITVNNTEVEVFGVLASNASAFWDYAGERFNQYIESDPDKLKITLVHEPFIFEEFQPETWGDLMLCGHTHGGTVRVPMIGPLFTREGGILPEKDGKFAYGRYEVVGSPLIVSAGLENNDLLRINNQPELVVVDINRF